LGGHQIFALGFSDSQQVVFAQNSYGEEWGNKGRFNLPYAYFSLKDPSRHTLPAIIQLMTFGKPLPAIARPPSSPAPTPSHTFRPPTPSSSSSTPLILPSIQTITQTLDA